MVVATPPDARLPPSTAPTVARRPDPADTTPRRISSDRLFDGAAEVQIEHHGAVYRLKQTSLGKLILTK